MSSGDLEREAENHIGRKKEILLAAAQIMRETEQRKELYRDIERALETLDWWDSLPREIRRTIIDGIAIYKYGLK